MMNKIKYLVFVVFIFVIFGVFYLWQKSQADNVFRIVADTGICVLQHQNQLFTFGDQKTEKSQIILRSLQDYFQKKIVWNLEEQILNQETMGNNWRIQKVSENFLRGIWDKTTIFFIKDFTSEELTYLKSQPIGFSSDFWVLEKSQIPDFFSPPTQAILFLGERKYSKKLEEFAQTNQIPLIFVKELNGILLEPEQVTKKWKLKTR